MYRLEKNCGCSFISIVINRLYGKYERPEVVKLKINCSLSSEWKKLLCKFHFHKFLDLCQYDDLSSGLEREVYARWDYLFQCHLIHDAILIVQRRFFAARPSIGISGNIGRGHEIFPVTAKDRRPYFE